MGNTGFLIGRGINLAARFAAGAGVFGGAGTAGAAGLGATGTSGIGATGTGITGATALGATGASLLSGSQAAGGAGATSGITSGLQGIAGTGANLLAGGQAAAPGATFGERIRGGFSAISPQFRQAENVRSQIQSRGVSNQLNSAKLAQIRADQVFIPLDTAFSKFQPETRKLMESRAEQEGILVTEGGKKGFKAGIARDRVKLLNDEPREQLEIAESEINAFGKRKAEVQAGKDAAMDALVAKKMKLDGNQPSAGVKLEQVEKGIRDNIKQGLIPFPEGQGFDAELKALDEQISLFEEKADGIRDQITTPLQQSTIDLNKAKAEKLRTGTGTVTGEQITSKGITVGFSDAEGAVAFVRDGQGNVSKVPFDVNIHGELPSDIKESRDALGNRVIINTRTKQVLSAGGQLQPGVEVEGQPSGRTQPISQTEKAPPVVSIKDLGLSTGVVSGASAGIARVFGSFLPGTQFPKTQRARQDVRTLNQVIKRVLTNSRRFPQGEQNTIKGFLVDPDKFFNDPPFAFDQMLGLRIFIEANSNEMQSSLDNVNLTPEQRKLFTDKINDNLIILSMIPGKVALAAKVRPDDITVEDINNMTDREIEQFPDDLVDNLSDDISEAMFNRLKQLKGITDETTGTGVSVSGEF